MPAILSHEKRNFRGQGLADVIGAVSNFISNNKDVISGGAKAVSDVVKIGTVISDVVKKSNELKELQTIKEAYNRRVEQPREISQSVKDKLASKGSGFKIVTT